MKITLENNNRVFFIDKKNKIEIHPFWLRERVNGSNFIDNRTKQRLFDSSLLSNSINIKKANINKNTLDLLFDDGVSSRYKLNILLLEFSKKNILENINKKLWNSSLKKFPIYEYKNNFSESREMLKLLESFYIYGFVIIKKIPTKKNFIIDFANSIGSVRRTNFGEFFNVKSIPKPNDLAYTTLPLSPHTDNPYRNPVPCIQLLHCIINEVSGGLSTLVDGFAVAKYLKKKHNKLFNILTNVKVNFKFIDKDIILENIGELIETDHNNNIRQVRFSNRLDFVPLLTKDKLNSFYEARKLLSSLYNSKKFEISFKLKKGELLMMDNYRLLHGRTKYDSSEGERFLQGCYIDYDSTEGKLRHLKRKFKIN